MRTATMADGGGDFDLRPEGWLTGLVAALGGGGLIGGIWTWLSAQAKARVDLVGIAQKAAHDQIVDLRTDIDRARDDAAEARREADQLRDRVATLEDQHLALSRDHHALMLANETLQATNDDLRRTNQAQAAEIAMLRSENVNLTGELRRSKQTLESIEAVRKT